MRTIAPAKINWTLEVLGKRDDGYHEIRSVMQTIDLCDVLSLEPAERLTLEVEGPHTADDDDLILKAARIFGSLTGREPNVKLLLEKRIPVGAGLGGGSSDAAAALRLLNATLGLPLDTEELRQAASGIGSDVPFFLAGGTALAEGRGEVITPLPDVPEVWLIVIVPPPSITPPLTRASKTAAMYGALTPADFTAGSHSETLVGVVRRGALIGDGHSFNCFDVAADRVSPALSSYRCRLRDAGANSEHVAGSGPALFSVFDSEDRARGVAHAVADETMKVFVARTLRASEATVVVDG